jgi:hypothetical protein
MTNQDEAERVRLDLIRKRAYEIHHARGYQHGFDQEDWFQAEREIDGLRDDETFHEQEHDEPRTEEMRDA